MRYANNWRLCEQPTQGGFADAFTGITGRWRSYEVENTMLSQLDATHRRRGLGVRRPTDGGVARTRASIRRGEVLGGERQHEME
jgi:hypothetical protein